jgi:HK97 family phage major capsid protein
MSTRDLLERRANLVREMREITNAPSDGGDLSAEQAAKFDSFKTQLEAVEKSIERQRLIDETERRMQGGESLNKDDHFTRACKDFSLQRAIAAQIDPRAVDAGREIEISSELAKRSRRKPRGVFVPLECLVEKRVQTIVAPGSGSSLVQTDVLAEQFIDVLRPSSVAVRLGARVLTGLRDNIALPKLSTTPAAEWVLENAALTPADHAFVQVTGEPHFLGTVTTYSRRMMLQTNPSIESILRSDFASKLGAGVDAAALIGDGAATAEPEGIQNNSDVNTIAAVGVPAYVDILSAVAYVESSNVPMTSLGWAANPWCRSTLQQTPRLAGDATGTSGFVMDLSGNLAGYPFLTTSALPGDPNAGPPAVAGEMVFGNWNELIIAFWGDAGADILVNPFESTAYLAGNVHIRGYLDADVLIRHGEAFCYLDGITLVAPS